MNDRHVDGRRRCVILIAIHLVSDVSLAWFLSFPTAACDSAFLGALMSASVHFSAERFLQIRNRNQSTYHQTSASASPKSSPRDTVLCTSFCRRKCPKVIPRLPWAHRMGSRLATHQFNNFRTPGPKLGGSVSHSRVEDSDCSPPCYFGTAWSCLCLFKAPFGRCAREAPPKPKDSICLYNFVIRPNATATQGRTLFVASQLDRSESVPS